MLYRGLKIKKEVYEQYLVGSTMHLTGYTSTTTDPAVANKFAIRDLDQDENKNKIPVIFIIEFTSQRGLFAMTDEYSAFKEKEVLI